MRSADPTVRNNVTVTGRPGGTPIVFAHGLGGTKESWRFVAPAFEDDYRVVVFDHVGAGGSDTSTYDRAKYDSLNGFADDVVELIEALEVDPVVFVGHSVAGIIGVLAANQRPDLFRQLILLGPSPRYVDTDGYTGGFSEDAVDDLLTSMDSNYLSWSSELAPMLMGNPDRPHLSSDLAAVIASAEPAMAAQFARATFLGDNRRDLADVTVPTVILQSAEDNIASRTVGQYVHEQIPDSRLAVMPTHGHVTHLSAPDEVIAHIRAHLA
jgi:sigma-B regulation protein RsbQ